MTKRTILWLAGALAVFVLLAVIGQRRNVPSTPQTDTVFLAGLMDSIDQLEGIEIVGAGNMPVATLDRDSDGWAVRERDGYPADLTKVRHTLLTLAEATVLEAKTANPELHTMLGVEDIDDPQASGLAVTLNGVTPPVTVIVGEEAGDYRRYVRRGGDDQSYLINRDPEIGAAVTDWLDPVIIDLPSARVRSVTVTHPGGEVVRISKMASEQANFTVENIPEGRNLLYDSVANVMAGVLQNLELEDVERDTGAADDEIVARLTTFDGLLITVRGAQRGDGHWISFAAQAVPGEAPARAADAGDGAAADPAAQAQTLNARLGGWRYQIPAYKFEQLTRNMDDLLQAQP